MIYSDKNLSQKLELAEARSNVDFVKTRAEMFPESGARWITVAGAFAMYDGAESPLTQTFGLGMSGEATNEDFEQLEAFFKERGAPVFHEVSPLADASVLNLLNRRGYQPIEMTSVMYRPLAGEINSDVSINPKLKTRVVEAGEEKLWARTAAEGWSTEMPGLADFMFELGQISAKTEGGLPFLTELENQPIAAGMFYIYDDVALLAGASTVPAWRNQGAQFALLDARLKYAARHNCRIAMMCALPGSQSQRNAEKNNFRIAYTRTKWRLKD